MISWYLGQITKAFACWLLISCFGFTALVLLGNRLCVGVGCDQINKEDVRGFKDGQL